MRKVLQPLLIAVAFCVVPASPAVAVEELSVSDLLKRGAELAGEQVMLLGELIGDYGFRDDGSMWTQLNDDDYVRQPIREGGTPAGANSGIALRMPTNLRTDLGPPGGYRYRGPIVRVTGTWKYHDPSRQGESYVEVESLTVIQPGRRLDQDVNWITIIVGALLLVAAGATAWLTRSEDARSPNRRMG